MNINLDDKIFSLQFQLKKYTEGKNMSAHKCLHESQSRSSELPFIDMTCVFKMTTLNMVQTVHSFDSYYRYMWYFWRVSRHDDISPFHLWYVCKSVCLSSLCLRLKGNRVCKILFWPIFYFFLIWFHFMKLLKPMCFCCFGLQRQMLYFNMQN